MKTCSRCQQLLPFESFNRRADRASLQSSCKECHKLEARAWYQKPENQTKTSRQARERAKRLRQMITKAKEQPCMDCGVAYPYYVMQYDHRDPSQKLVHLAGTKILSMSEQAVLDEIAKCDVVCANCHAERTQQRRLAV